MFVLFFIFPRSKYKPGKDAGMKHSGKEWSGMFRHFPVSVSDGGSHSSGFTTVRASCCRRYVVFEIALQEIKNRFRGDGNEAE